MPANSRFGFMRHRARGSRRPKGSPTRPSTSSAREVGPDNVEITLGFVGVQNAAYPINTIHLWTSGPEEAFLQVQLNREAGIRVSELQERLRKLLPQEMPGRPLQLRAE